ncbi:MAG: hypothetical protein V4549_07715 [Bacteroidota bacterium]
MEITMYRWNNELIAPNSGKKATLTLFVTTAMIQTVIEKSNCKGWKIELKGMQVLSNLTRNCATMSITTDVYFLNNILKRLEIPHVEQTNVDYYRYAMEVLKKNRFEKMNYILFNSKTKISKMVSNTPFPVIGKQSKGTGALSHLLARRIN